MILSQIAFALGACGGLARILMPPPVNTEPGAAGESLEGQHRLRQPDRGPGRPGS
jgi:hypothetical protein